MAVRKQLDPVLAACLFVLLAGTAHAGGGGGATSEAGQAPSSSGARDSGASTGAAESGPGVTGDNDHPCPTGQRWNNDSAACEPAAGPNAAPAQP